MRRSLPLLAATFLFTAACLGEFEPSTPTGDDDESGVDAAPDPEAPDADTTPGTPDAAPPAADAGPAGAETLKLTFETTPKGGPYAPDNVVAVWIEGPGGAFQKTIGRWAAVRAKHLVAWAAKSGLDADAVSGATRQNHATPLTITWDLKDKAGQVVPDGTYTIRMELADANSTQATQNHQGTFTFDKNGTAAKQTTQGNGFNNVSIDYSGR